jgi:hypothetical protein
MSTTAAQGTWRVGEVVEDLYEVREVITSGGMGVVHRVYHRGWNLELAVGNTAPGAGVVTATDHRF